MDNETEKRSIEIVEELRKLDEGHVAMMGRWEENDKVCVELQRELEHARLTGRGLKEAYTAFHRAQWDRDREKSEADIKRTKLRGELGQLNKEVVSDGIEKFEVVLENANKKRIREAVKTAPIGPGFARKTTVAKSNDSAFRQILQMITETKNKLTGMRERASIPEIEKFIQDTLEQIRAVSMEPVEYEIGDGIFLPLENEKINTASMTETIRAQNDAEYGELTRRVESMRKEVKGMTGR